MSGLKAGDKFSLNLIGFGVVAFFGLDPLLVWLDSVL